MELLKRVEKTIRDERLVQAGDRIVVAVSGGPDSMALLHVLFSLRERLRIGLVAAHVNHRFRGAESDREADIVAAFAEELGVPCEMASIDVPDYIARTGMNPQAAAREKRYAFLREAAGRHGAKKIALAHHADDQAETVLMRLLRGSGPSGLAGMPIVRAEKNLELIRPLLRIYKSEIECHCADYGLPVCRDSSNESRKYFRNEIRLDVIPFLRQYSDRLPESLNRLAEIARAEDEWMEAETRRTFAEIVSVRHAGDGTECVLESASFAVLPIALQRRLIKLILNYVFSEADLSDFARIESARSVIVRERREALTLDLHDKVKLVREYGTVRFVQALPDPEPYAYAITRPDARLRLPEAGLTLECSLLETDGASAARLLADRNGSRDEAYFDYDRVPYPLSVRSRQPGDRMNPFGLKGTKKVKDMFVDEKLPPAARQRIPLVLDAAGRILWIPGVRRSAHAPVSETTTRVLAMKVRSFEG
ncbi:tRNA lysidine(34) synthetase TilS [Paenibacillus flagellatus]|uniref:tRNA(Ile)-lysidine synthase n=1 Tax=Paenibacillus flagellatus TaxID=2211139 RepID=A0A2V5KP51_9BACL|nr:tRNA lysidine(34) synthetase TilS [Paenibacillus flagellatus]PYI50236.1 tRNA lysidine(34) synthetase TilS [Paenibacillus flagellatus]